MMKKFNLSLMVLLLASMFVFVACSSDNSEASAKEKARESLATTAPNANKSATAAKVQTKEPTGPTTTISFSETTFNFGDVEEGEKVSHIYKFTNTGNEPLVISNAKGSCGCTVPKWPKDPIPAGETGEILVEFNSKGKPGKQTKRVTVTANTDPANSFLTITGNVIKKDAPTG